MQATPSLSFFTPEFIPNSGAILVDAGISAGIPVAVGDINEECLSLDVELVRNKETTFYARVSGQSMIGAGLDDNDLLVIDRSIAATHNKIAVCFLDGEFTVKRLKVENGEVWLKPENPNYSSIQVTEANDFVIWGIVTNVIKRV
ncbi:LexA family protein [Formosa sp. 3Alg 14/1]|uniref:LexA family protein n=1 Tax=Formosa sp. 3Alg 14/1 TaxID=3382190 RepID=UPI0039BE6FD0